MRNYKKKSFGGEFYIFLFILLGVGVLACVQIVKALPSGNTPDAPGRKFDVAQATNSVMTTSQTYADMPDMSVSFTSSGNNQALAMFSSASPVLSPISFPGCGYYMRLVVDGTTQSDDIPMDFSTLAARNFNFVIAPLSPGLHTAKIQWRTGDHYYQEGCANTRSLVVMH